MAGGVRLEFSQFGNFDSFSIYRSLAPMVESSLPPPLVSGLAKMYHVDATAEEDTLYYYRVSVVRDGAAIVSDEVSILTGNTSGPVLTIPDDYILRYDFDGNAIDKSTTAAHGIKSDVVNYVAGRKVDTQCASFVDGYIKTSQPLPFAGSDKVSISFWVKSSAENLCYVLSYQSAVYNLFNLTLNTNGAGVLTMNNGSGFTENNVGVTGVFDGNWHHVVVSIDRSIPVAVSNKIHVDNADSPLSSSTVLVPDNFIDIPLTIGANGSGSYRFSGLIQDIRVYNRILSSAERTALFDE